MTEERSGRRAIHEEMQQVRATFHELLGRASPEDLRRGTRGTRWDNGQLLFHMVFGYLIVLRLLPLVRIMSRLPDAVSRNFARVLNMGTRPFHTVNYLGSCGGAMVFRGERLAARMDRTIDALHRHLDAEDEAQLSHGMHFPVDWDPYFRDVMTVAELYHYGTLHFEHHRRQLTIEPEPDQ